MCRGHFHAPGTQVPLDKFYVHRGKWRNGKPFSECIECWQHRGVSPAKIGDEWNQRVPMSEVAPVLDELFRRIGATEAARRAGLHKDTLHDARLRKQEGMRLVRFKKVQEVLEEARAAGEDNFDAVEHNKRNLIPGGPPGAREHANVVRLAKMKEARRREDNRPRNNDLEVVLCSELAPVVDEWRRKWSLNHPRDLGWQGMKTETQPMGAIDWLAEKTGLHARRINSILACEPYTVGLSTADKILAAIDETNALIFGTIRVIPNPRMNLEVWQERMAERGCT